MVPETGPPLGSLWFRCNICGKSSFVNMQRLGREVRSCTHCGSTGRFRAIIRALSCALLGENLALPDFPVRRDLSGFGMTDWDEYAVRLAEKFCYENTYYHQEPRLDIAATELPAHRLGGSDFIISSEIFEHIVAPVSRAFENVFRLLKPGGIFILTTPFGGNESTIEHFPELHDFQILEKEGGYVLRNVTATGLVQEYSDLVFHGGPGSTLEMRVFARNELLQHLHAAGFEEIVVYEEPDFPHGIWWYGPWSFPFSARRPR